LAWNEFGLKKRGFDIIVIFHFATLMSLTTTTSNVF